MLVNKADLLDEAGGEEATDFLAGLGWPAATVLVSAQTGHGTDELERALREALQRTWAAEAQAAAVLSAAPVVLRPGEDRLEAFTVEAAGDHFVVHGVQLERLFAKADLENDDALAYLQTIIERAGLNDALRRAGARARRHGGGGRAGVRVLLSHARGVVPPGALLQSRP